MKPVIPSLSITKHFDIKEFLYSKVAEQNGILENNIPSLLNVYNNIIYVIYMLEIIRYHCAFPIKITSGYRCRELNELVGGSPNSNHLLGLAVDIDCGNTRNKILFDICNLFKQDNILPINELINENDFSWIHISFYKL